MSRLSLENPAKEFVSGGLRPAERVLDFINGIAGKEALGKECRLPSIRQISRTLDVSVPTVQGVFRKLAADGMIRTRVGDGTFLSAAPCRTRGLKVALNFSMQQDPRMEDWMMCISMGILRAASSSSAEVSLSPIQEDDINDERAIERIMARRKDVDALALFPCDRMAKIREVYEADRKPVVNVTQPSFNATCDFVSPDYYSASFALGRALRNAGRRRALLLLAQSMDGSAPMRSVHAGFANGFGVGCADGARFEVVEGVGHCEQAGSAIIRERLSHGSEMPDAVYSSNDYLALGAVAAFRDAGVKVPDDVSVIGGTGLSLLNAKLPGLTRVAQPMERVGAELLSMICRRAAGNGESVPGVFIPAGFIGSETARPQELAELGVEP